MAKKFGMSAKKNVKPYKTKTKSTMTTQWINNAMKSIGISASAQFKSIAPIMSESFSTLKSSAADISNTQKNASMESVRASIDNNKYVKYGKKAINNALEDLKSGKFNNTERANDDFDSSDEYGWSFGDFDDEESDGGVTINYNGSENESEVVNATYELNKSVNKQTEFNLQASKATIDTLISTSAASLLQGQQIGNEIINHLNSVNSTLSSILTFQQENTMKMYEMTTAFMEKMGAKDETKEYKDNPADPTNVFQNGRFNLNGYKNFVKGSFKKAIASDPILSVLGMVDDNMIEMLISNPLSAVSGMVASKMIPAALSSAVSSMDKALEEFMPTMLNRLADWGKNSGGISGQIKRFIGNAFGVKSDLKNSTSSEGKVTKEVATFDKITRNSIVEVIPKYLRESNAYLKTIAESFDKNSTKKNLDESQIFDAKQGGYIKFSEINKSITDELTETITDVFSRSRFGSTLNNAIANLKEEDREGMDKVIEQLALLIAEKTKSFNPSDLSKGSEMDRIIKQLETSNENQKALITNVIKSMTESRDFGLSLDSYRFQAQAAFNDALDGLNEDGVNWLSSDYNNNENVIETIYKNKGYNKSLKSRKDLEEAQKRLSKRKLKESEKGMKSLARMNKKDVRGMAKDAVGNMKYNESTVRANMDDTYLDKDLLTRSAGHIKNGMWELMFGTADGAKSEFGKLFTEPMKDLYHSLKDDFITPFKDELFGKDNEDGKSKGLFSGIKGSFKDVISELSHSITGKEYTDSSGVVHEKAEHSVASNMRSMFNTIREGVTEKLFGKTSKEDLKDNGKELAKKGAGKITSFVDILGKGLAGWREALFGNDDMSPEELKEDTLKKLKEGLPDGLTGSVVGATTGALAGGSLLGALIGGPIGGAVLGFAGGFLKRSERFQNFLFGEKDEETGERLGGIISRETQDFFKKNKNLITGGAVVGLARNVILGKSGGILGTIVGGPIAGALMGVGTTFLFKSKMFNEFLFGDEEKGKKGILTAFKGILKKQSKDGTSNAKKLGMGIVGAGAGALTMAAISKVGLLGFMTGPAGLIGGALIGLGLSIKAQSSKFKEWLFGSKERTESGEKKKAGLVGKISNRLIVSLVNPIKARARYIWQDIKDTVKYDILDVMRLTISPITNGIANMFKKGKEGTSKLLKMATGAIAKEFAPLVQKVTEPFMKAADFITNALYETSKSLITMPFKIVGFVGRKLESGMATIVKGAFKYIIKPVGSLALNLTKSVFKTIGLATKILLTPARLIKKGIGKGLGMLGDKLGVPILDTIKDKAAERRQRKKEKLENGPDTLRNSWAKRKLARKENKEQLKRDKKLNKNQAFIAKWTNGERYLYTEENIKLAEANAKRAGKSIKWKKGIDLELTPEERKEQEKAKILAGKSNNDIAGANDAELNIEERQLGVMQRIYNFLLGKTPDGKDKKEEAKKDNKEDTNEEEEKEETLLDRLETMGGPIGAIAKVFNMYNGGVDKVSNAIDTAVNNYEFGDISKSLKGKITAKKEAYKAKKQKRYDEAQEQLEKLQAARREKESRDFDNTLDEFISENSGDVPHYAKGTKKAKKGLAIVGEEKPEIVDFKGGERVISDKQAPINVRLVAFSKKAKKDMSESNATVAKVAAGGDPIHEAIEEIRKKHNKDEEKEKKEAEELKAAQEEGSYKNQRKEEEEKKEAEATKSRNPIVNAINKLRGENKKNHSFLSSVLGLFSKKGLIGAGLIALSPVILKYLPSVLKTVVDNLPAIMNGIKSIGKFIGNLAGDAIDYFTEDGKEGNRTDGKTGFQETKDEVTDSVKDLKNGDINGFLFNDKNGMSDSKTDTKINTLVTLPKMILKTKKAIAKVAKNENAFGKVHLINNALYSKTDKSIAKFANTDAGKDVIKAGKNLKTKAVTGAKNLGKKGITGAKNLGKKGVSKLANSVKSAAAKNEKGLLAKTLNVIQKAFDIVSSKFGKKAAEQGVKEGAEAGAKNIFKTLFSTLKTKLAQKFATVSAKISAAFAADTALGAATAGIGTFIKNNLFSVAFGINEASNPRKLFRIPKGSKVDWKMRVIAASWGALKGYGALGTVLDIINEFSQNEEGTGLFDAASEMLYKLLCSATGDKKGAARLDKLQEKQMSKYKEYQESQYRKAYEKYLDDNGLDEDDLPYEEFCAGVPDKYKVDCLSFADWNAQQNKTLGAKILDGAKSAGKAIVGGVKAVGKGVGKVAKTIWNVDKKIYGTAFNVAKKAGKAIWKADKKIYGTAFNVGKKVLGFNKKVAGKAVKASPLGLGVTIASDIMTLTSEKEVKCWVDEKNNRIYVKDGDSYQVFNLKNKKYIETISDKDKVADIKEAIENGEFEVSKFPVKKMKTALRSLESFATKAGKKVSGFWDSLFGDKKKKKKKTSKKKAKTTEVNTKEAWFSREDLSYYIENDDGTWSHYGANGKIISKAISDRELAEFKRDRSFGLYVKQSLAAGKQGAAAAISKINNLMPETKKQVSSAKVGSELVKKVKSYLSIFTGGKKKDKDDDKKKSGSGGDGIMDMIKGQISGSGEGDKNTLNGFKYYSQYNKKWRNTNYSSGKNKGTIGSAGCGPASMSMVVSQLSGQDVTPDVMANYAKEGGYRDENGTNSKFMETAGNKFGINNTRIDNPKSSQVISEIKKGNPVILNGISNGSANSPYTSKGHYIVAVGVDKKGNIIVNDPRGKGFSGRVNPKALDSQSRVGWVYSKKKRITGFGGEDGKINDKGIVGKLKAKANKFFNFGGFGEETDVEKARRAVYAWMKAVENKLTYSQENRSDECADKGLTGTGSGDCSSTVRWAYHRALGDDFKMGANTSEQCGMQYPYPDLITFPGDEIDKNGTNNLCCGDLIYFHESGVDKPCHVEMYVGEGDGKEVMGHGGGSHGEKPGPHYGNIAWYSKSTPVYCIRRLITKESVKGRTIKFPEGGEAIKVDSAKEKSGTTSTSSSSDSSSTSGDNILTKWQSSFSESIDKMATGATNYLMTGDKSKLTVDSSTSSNSSSTGSDSSSSATKQYPAVAVATGDVPKAVWDFFTKMGYSKAATAGIMGNLYGESGMNPASIQSNGAGPAAGIAQWENYNTKSGRWLAMSNYANSKGKDWTDLQSQLEYIDSELNSLDPYFTKDISLGNGGGTHSNVGSQPTTVAEWKKSDNWDMATRQFEAGFERAGKPHIEKRLSAAQTYYNQFAGGDTSGSGGDDQYIASMLDDQYSKFEDEISRDVSGSGDTTYKYNGNIYDKQNYDRTNRLGRMDKQTTINNNFNTSNMETLLSEVINVLNDIKSNTHDSYEALNKMPSNNGGTNNIILANGKSSKNVSSNNVNKIKNKNYQLASKIAQG